ncbi:MAG: anti-sigma factor family protein [Bacteroidota bacterium]
MNCKDIQIRMPELLDGTIDGEGKNFLQDHLGQCPSCKKDFEELTLLYTMMKSDKPWAPPAAYWNGLIPRIQESINNSTRPPLVAPAWIQRFTVSAAAIAMIIVVFNMIPGNIDEKEIDYHSIVAQGPADEVQNFIDGQEIEGLADQYAGIQNTSVLGSDDKANLREVIGEDQSSIDDDNAIESLSSLNDKAVNDIVTKINSKAIFN